MTRIFTSCRRVRSRRGYAILKTEVAVDDGTPFFYYFSSENDNLNHHTNTTTWSLNTYLEQSYSTPLTTPPWTVTSPSADTSSAPWLTHLLGRVKSPKFPSLEKEAQFHSSPMVTRAASHAGSWYSDHGSTLSSQLDGWLSKVDKTIENVGTIPQPGARVIIAP